MFTKEDLDSWNELFPECKVREQDLSNPTEVFITKVLISYLQKFGCKVEPPFSLTAVDGNENLHEKRLFLIKLAYNCDKILKITDKSYALYYYDLIRPSPKKTSHILSILLNYLYYYNMYKTNIFEMASNRIKTRQDLLAAIKRTQEDNTERRERAEKIEDTIAKLKIREPMAEAELENIMTRKSRQHIEFQQLQESLKELEANTKDLNSQFRSLKKQIVPNAETRNLKQQLCKLEENIEESKRTKKATDACIKERKGVLSDLQVLIKNIEEAKEIFPAKVLQEYKEVNKKLRGTELPPVVLENQKEHLLQMNAKQENMLKSFEEKIQMKKNQREQEAARSLQLIENKTKVRNSQKQQVVHLNEEEHGLECSLQGQKDTSLYLEENIAEIFLTTYDFDSFQIEALNPPSNNN